MSFTTTIMFAPRIWGFDLSTPEARVARQAGWRRADILWEGLMEAANAAFVAGDTARAASLFRRGAWVARLTFARDDLRRATGLVNLGLIARLTGREDRACRLLQKALQNWDYCAEQAIAQMQIAPRARSSLFHLRMEARHRATYHDNLRKRLTAIAAEVGGAIRDLEQRTPPAHRLYSRWLGERPTVYDDTRKVLGACLLIAETTTQPAG